MQETGLTKKKNMKKSEKNKRKRNGEVKNRD